MSTKNSSVFFFLFLCSCLGEDSAGITIYGNTDSGQMNEITSDSIITETDSEITSLITDFTSSNSDSETDGGQKPQSKYCGDSILGSDEECDDGNSTNDDGCTDTCKRDRIVFITEYGFRGYFNEMNEDSSYDALEWASNCCQQFANKAQLDNAFTFKAWLSDHDTNAADVIFHGEGRYVRVDGVVVGESMESILSNEELLAPISTNEFGVDNVYVYANHWGSAWTGTLPNGKRVPGSDYCDDWTSHTYDLEKGSAHDGSSGAMDYKWTWDPDWGPSFCFEESSFYCFEGKGEQRCGNGIIEDDNLNTNEDCDDGNFNNEDGCNRFCKRDRVVFVTSELMQGNLGGVDGADAICKKLAEDANLDNFDTFVAWLGDVKNDATHRIFKSRGRYVRTDGKPIALDFAYLANGLLINPINLDETGEIVSGNTKVWTASHPDGWYISGSTGCSDWTITDFEQTGYQGNSFATDISWTDVSTLNNQPPTSCNEFGRLYCFEGK